MKDKLSFVGGIAPEVMGTLARKMCDDKSCNQNSLNQSEKKIINNGADTRERIYKKLVPGEKSANNGGISGIRRLLNFAFGDMVIGDRKGIPHGCVGDLSKHDTHKNNKVTTSQKTNKTAVYKTSKNNKKTNARILSHGREYPAPRARREEDISNFAGNRLVEKLKLYHQLKLCMGNKSAFSEESFSKSSAALQRFGTEVIDKKICKTLMKNNKTLGVEVDLRKYSDLLKRLEVDLLEFARELREKTDWSYLARENQKPPEGDWLIWLILAGRGFGKTRTGAETVRKWVNEGLYKNIALIADTIDDAREVMVEGASGLLKISQSDKNTIQFEPSKRKLTWKNGATAYLYSSENYEKLRGPQFDLIWIDELAKFRYPDEIFDQAMLTLRLGKKPRAIITTTPKPIPIIKRLMDRADVAVTKGSTYENTQNLSEIFINNLREQFENTELGAQEIYAEILEPTRIFLWDRALIENAKVDATPPESFLKVVLSIDPALTATEGSDETGIILAGVDCDGLIYILEDLSARAPPSEWCDLAIAAYYKFEADEIIVETNAGGSLVEQLIHVKDPLVRIREVFAKKGKIARAEPIVPLYKSGRVKHAKTFEALERQMMNYSSGATNSLVKGVKTQKSPDRMDALVWAISELKYYYENMPKITLI